MLRFVVFWRIKMSAGAIIHCRLVKKKFQMWPAYACLLNDIRQKTNRLHDKSKRVNVALNTVAKYGTGITGYI
jgi:hypothetical protein